MLIANTYNRSKQDYLDELSRQGVDRCTAVPFSADYIVGRDGSIDQLLPLDTCVSIPLCGNTATRYITVVLEGDDVFTRQQMRVAARLVCCLVRHYSLFDPQGAPLVRAIGELDSTKLLRRLPTEFRAFLSACLSGDEPDVEPSPQPQCCDVLRDDLARLRDDLARLRDRIAALEARPDLTPRVQQLEARVQALEARVQQSETRLDALQAQVATFSARIARLEACYERLPQCAESPPPCEIVYRIGAPLRLVPMINQIVDFSVRVQDQDPPLVTTGPLWQAMLSNGGPARTWTVSGELLIDAREWCVNKGVRLYLQDCSGALVQVAQWVSPANGAQPPVVLTWSHPITTMSGQPCFVRLVLHSDDTTQPFYSVSGGYVRMQL
ncbi:MAG: hypothetical protein RML84_09160 [Anaerolineae bacterium]|nr:hypothetical protein [Anaerolineae bacterium]